MKTITITEKHFTVDANDVVTVKGSFTLILSERNDDRWWFTSGKCDEIEICETLIAEEKANFKSREELAKAYEISQKTNENLKKYL